MSGFSPAGPAPAGAGGIATILDSIADGVFTVGPDWRITSFNRAAELILGISRDEAMGQPCCDVFRASVCETDCCLRRTIETGDPVVGQTIYIIDSGGRRVPISISTALLRDERGKVIGGVETFRDLGQVTELRRELEGDAAFSDIVTQSPAMDAVLGLLPRVAASDSTLLITGESGTGKELIARTVHNIGPRRDGPFVAVNVAALPDTLLESELFGHRAGAFTGAVRDREGRFGSARGGTLFLDEIGDVSPAMQVRLLRVLQERTYVPVGGAVAERTDARVIAATNRDLRALAASGRFREDLFYRLDVVGVELPSLRERREDVPLLVDHFIDRLNRIQGRNVRGAAQETLALLALHDFPGNIRELRNIIEHAFALCTGEWLRPEHLPANLRNGASMADGAAPRTLDEMEKWVIERTLRRCGWHRQAAADALGIHKTTLFRKIAALGVELPEQDGRSQRRT